MSKNKNYPVPHREQLPADDEARLPAPPGANGGIVKQGLSRFWARLGSGTTDQNTELIKSQHRYIEAYGELADTAYETKRKVDRLRHDLPSQLVTDRADHEDKMDDAQYQIQLRRAQREATLAAFHADDERNRMTRDLDYMRTASDKRRALHHASRQETQSRVRRSVMQRTADMQVEQAINAFVTGDYATLDKLMRAKHGFEQAWGEEKQEVSAASGLEQRLAILQEMLAKAKSGHASAEFQLKLHEEIDALENEIEAANAGRELP